MKVKITLNLSGTNNAQLLIDSEGYITNITGNPRFAAAEIVAQVSATKTSITNLHVAMNAPLSENKTDSIKIARDVLDRNLTRLANMVEDLANDPNTPEANRLEMVHSAGMVVKSQHTPQKHQFAASNGAVSGSVILTATGGANAHEWKYTSDITGFTNKISVDTTTTAKTEISNLKKASEYAFFHKAIISGVKTDWEGPLFLVIV
jgi:hypothetical protein